MPTETVRNSDASKVPRNIQRSCLLGIATSNAQRVSRNTLQFLLLTECSYEIICQHKHLSHWNLVYH
jgi:hypothetical protein